MLVALLLLATLAASPAPPATGALTVSVSDPRNFGYFLGDVIRRTVVVRAAPDMRLDPATLPHPGALNYWLDLTSVDASSGAGASFVEYRIVLSYQVFYAPLDPRYLTIPGFTAKFIGQGGSEEAPVPGFSFLISPLRELFADKKIEGAALVMQPDAPARLLPTAPERTAMALAGIVALAFLALLARHYAWGPFRQWPARPFTGAARFLKQNAGHLSGQGGYKAALLKLHRAFDAAAGHRLLTEDLANFLAEHPEFASLEGDIERLFATSRRAFFSDDVARARADLPLPLLADLGSRLAAAERSAA